MRAVLLLSAFVALTAATCLPKESVALEEGISELEGVWYKVAHVTSRHNRYKSSTVKLEADGEDKLKVTEYHVSNKDDSCHGPVTGTFTKRDDGNFDLEVNEGDDKTTVTGIKLLFKETGNTHTDDTVVILYWCEPEADGDECDHPRVSVLSRYRRPMTSVVYNAVQHLRATCVELKQMIRLDTASTCGNELVSESHQASSESEESAEPEPDAEAEPEPEPESESAEAEPEPEPHHHHHHHHRHHHKKCIVPDIPGIPLDDFPMEPFKGYLAASNSDWYKTKGVTHLSWDFRGETKGEGDTLILVSHYESIIHGVCYTGKADEWADPEDETGATYIQKVQYMGDDNEVKTFEEKGKVVYMKHGLFVTYRCDKEVEGGCEKPIFNVWSETRHIRHGALFHMHQLAMKHCTDPRDYVYLNTHADCIDPVDGMAKHEHQHHEESDENKCKVEHVHACHGFSMEKLEGSWYLVAMVMSERLRAMAPQFYHGSFAMNINATDKEDELSGEYYEDIVFKSASGDRSYQGPGACNHGTKAKITEGSEHGVVTVDVDLELKDKDGKVIIKNPSITVTVLHIDPQLLLVYNCHSVNAETGVCDPGKSDMALFSRSRFLRQYERLSLFPHFEATCIPYSDVYFPNLHSHCAMPLENAFGYAQGAHAYLAMSHKDVLDMVAKCATKQCLQNEVVGEYVCLKKWAKAGPWYTLAAYGEKGTEATYIKYQYAGNGVAVGRAATTYMMPDGTRTCQDVDMTVTYNSREIDGKTDYYYRTMISHPAVTSIRIGRFLWTNYKLAVYYSCDYRAEDGSCQNTKLYVMSRHESIDHHEWMVLENLIKSVCIEPSKVHHFSPHENCVHDYVMSGKKLYKTAEDCDWDNFEGLSVSLDDIAGTYHDIAVAHKTDPGTKSHTYKTEKDGDKLKLESRINIKDKCEKYTGSIEKPDADSTGLELTYKSKSSGKDKLLRYWLGASFTTSEGFYNAIVGCVGADCDDDTGFASISSKYRINDPAALHQTYRWFAEHCINPHWFRMLDTHDSCGADFDTRSCKVDEIAAAESLDDSTVNGKWYITAMNKHLYKSVACTISDGDEPGVKNANCFASYPHKDGCFEDSFEILVTPESTLACDGQSVPMCEPGGAKPGKILYQSADHMLAYFCMNKYEDGTCMTHETFVALLAKHATVEQDSLPQDLLDKLDAACVPWSNMRLSEKTDCGA